MKIRNLIVSLALLSGTVLTAQADTIIQCTTQQAPYNYVITANVTKSGCAGNAAFKYETPRAGLQVIRVYELANNLSTPWAVTSRVNPSSYDSKMVINPAVDGMQACVPGGYIPAGFRTTNPRSTSMCRHPSDAAGANNTVTLKKI